MWIHIFAITFLLILFLYKCTKKPNRFPPGPPRLPIIGSLPYINVKLKTSDTPSLMHGILQAFSKYGDIVGFYIGNEPQVAIADYNVIKDLLKREESNARQKLSPFQDFRPGGTTKGILDKDNSEGVPGIIFTRGKAWTDQRRFTLKVLKDFGFGKSSMEDTLVEEVDKFCKQIKKSIGIAVNPGLKMNISILNALWGMITGEKLPLDDPKLQNIVEKFNAFFTKSVFPSSSIASFFPYPPMIKWWIFTPFRNAIGFKLELLYTSVAAIANLCEEQIEQHKENLDEGDVNDFIDAYLVEIKKNEKNAHSSFYKDRGHYYLLNGMIDLFIAGMETTSASLTWTFLLLLHHPEIKRQLQKEIDTVIGRNRSPGFTDKEQMHYTNAVTLESFRIVSFAPFSVPHCATADIPVGNFIIPKGAGIFPGLLNAMYDPNHFPDPHSFKPERFLDGDGKYKPHDHVIPFSIGKRYCPGQSLAEREFFLFLVGILQKFDITSPPMQKLPSYHIDDIPVPGIVRPCPNYEMIFSLRE